MKHDIKVGDYVYHKEAREVYKVDDIDDTDSIATDHCWINASRVLRLARVGETIPKDRKRWLLNADMRVEECAMYATKSIRDWSPMLLDPCEIPQDNDTLISDLNETLAKHGLEVVKKETT